MSANDGIKRGDSARTGDLAAELPAEVDRAGAGVRAQDDGPAGQPTADSSAGELSVDGDFVGLSHGEDLGDLTVVSEDDPSLGLTAHGDVPAHDWAADTGPSRNPDRALATNDLTDRGSTLRPDR
jgi:hypothetical protein